MGRCLWLILPVVFLQYGCTDDVHLTRMSKRSASFQWISCESNEPIRTLELRLLTGTVEQSFFRQTRSREYYDRSIRTTSASTWLLPLQ